MNTSARSLPMRRAIGRGPGPKCDRSPARAEIRVALSRVPSRPSMTLYGVTAANVGNHMQAWLPRTGSVHATTGACLPPKRGAPRTRWLAPVVTAERWPKRAKGRCSLAPLSTALQWSACAADRGKL